MGLLQRLSASLGIKQQEPDAAIAPVRRTSMFSTHDDDMQYGRRDELSERRRRWETVQEKMLQKMPKPPKDGWAMDAMDSQGEGDLKAAYQLDQPEISEALLMWYSSQSFIGAQMCGIIAQHWLISKACTMPARDAIRNGYKVVSEEEAALKPEALKIIKQYDKAFNIMWNMEEQLRWARVFGIRVSFFKVNSTDPKYYEKPFNIDGVTPNSYRGIVQVDPYWMAPMLDGESSGDPSSMHFYEPTWWTISGKKYHRSHLIINIPEPVADIIKPSYIYGGVPLVQRIMERVYAAERTANEGPLLAMTKRTTVLKTNAAKALANLKEFMSKLAEWCHLRDNFQVKVIDKDEDELELHETSLADLDSVIMTQYQLVCSTADVPATRMLGTQPKGFNTTGESEESNYHESLQTLQTQGASPMLERHHLLVIKSYVEPKLGPCIVSHEWNALDVQTAKELAETNYIRSQTDNQLVQAGAVDGVDVRERLITDPESGYANIASAERPIEPELEDDEPTEGDDAAR